MQEEISGKVLSEKLIDITTLKNVGTTGGLRVYVPARLSKDSQFKFVNGDSVQVSVLTLKSGEQGILITKAASPR